MKRRNLGVIARGAAAVALAGGAVLAAAGTASATTSSVSDCRDFAARWGVDDSSVAERDVWWACRVGAHPELSDQPCEALMAAAIATHNAYHPGRWAQPWVGVEACRRAD